MTEAHPSPPRRRIDRKAFAVRYVLPGVLVLTGIVILALEPSLTGLDALIMFVGAGSSVLLLNVLYRLGVKGDEERDVEEAARAYFDEHGHWPPDDEPRPGREWSLAPGAVTLEMEEAQGRSAGRRGDRGGPDDGRDPTVSRGRRSADR